MPDRLPDRFFDTVTLSNFALSGAFDLLVDRYGRSLCVTEQVRAELASGRIRGYSELKVVEQALAAGSILPADAMTTPESEIFVDLLRNLGSGEASCVTLARHRNGIVATDDRAARRSCAERGVPVTGTIGILKALCTDKTITSEEADATLALHGEDRILLTRAEHQRSPVTGALKKDRRMDVHAFVAPAETLIRIMLVDMIPVCR